MRPRPPAGGAGADVSEPVTTSQDRAVDAHTLRELLATSPPGGSIPTRPSPDCADSRSPTSVTPGSRSEEHTSELQSLMRISYAVFCLKKKNLINAELHT